MRRVGVRRSWLVRLGSIAVALLAGHCGGGPSSPTNGAATISITSTGVSPAVVRAPLGGRVTFVNNDSRPHAMSSDPIQTHTDCPPINDVGTLSPGQSHDTGIMDVPRTCGYHDHINELDPTWKGQIVVQ
jgi:plastocyanin